MKIAYVNADSGIPIFGTKGASIHIRELVNALYGIDHQVNIFATKRGAAPDPTGLNAEVLKIRNLPTDQEQLDRDQLEDPRLIKEKRYIDLGNAIQTQLCEAYNKSAFDCIYERYSLWSAAGVRAARQLGIPCILEVNSPLLLEQQRYRKLVSEAVAASIEQEVFNGAEAIITVSKEVKQYIIDKVNRSNDVTVLFNGVDTERFNPSVQPGQVNRISNDDYIVGFVGSLKPWHGIDILLDAFRQLQRIIPRSHLLIVGDGPMRGWLDGYLHASQLRDKVTITGWVDYETLPSLIQRMDVTAAPYPMLEEFYFSPLKVFEYLAVGKPVVASNIGQLAEVIDHGDNGYLTEPGNVQQLAETLEYLYRNPDQSHRVGSAAASHARSFAWRENAKTVVGIFQTLINPYDDPGSVQLVN